MGDVVSRYEIISGWWRGATRTRIWGQWMPNLFLVLLLQSVCAAFVVLRFCETGGLGRLAWAIFQVLMCMAECIFIFQSV